MAMTPHTFRPSLRQCILIVLGLVINISLGASVDEGQSSQTTSIVFRLLLKNIAKTEIYRLLLKCNKSLKRLIL